MQKYRIELRNLDGKGEKRVRVYDMPSINSTDYWDSVTDVQCPCCEQGTIRWAEHLYVAGYRICDKCGRHFLAKGDVNHPALIRVGSRRS